MIITEVTHYFKKKNTKIQRETQKTQKTQKKEIEKTFLKNIFLYFFFLQKTIN